MSCGTEDVWVTLFREVAICGFYLGMAGIVVHLPTQKRQALLHLITPVRPSC